MRSNFTYACDGTASDLLPNDTNMSGQLRIKLEPKGMLSE
jgi:hypothetical protein